VARIRPLSIPLLQSTADPRATTCGSSLHESRRLRIFSLKIRSSPTMPSKSAWTFIGVAPFDRIRLSHWRPRKYAYVIYVWCRTATDAAMICLNHHTNFGGRYFSRSALIGWTVVIAGLLVTALPAMAQEEVRSQVNLQ